jgi:hypothetical protein
MFSQHVQAFLQTQMLASVGTIEPDGQPDVDVGGFEFDGTRFYIGGMSYRRRVNTKILQRVSRRYR